MFIGELAIRRSNIDNKIKELKTYLHSLPTDDTNSKGGIYKECLERIFILLEEYQRHTLLLNRSNGSSNIKIGDSDEVDVASALVLVDTILKKIEAVDEVIKNNDHSIDIFKLIEQRDSLMEEYVLLKSTIYANDWNTEVD